MSNSKIWRGRRGWFLPRRPVVWIGRVDVWNSISQLFPGFEYGLEDTQLVPRMSEGQDEERWGQSWWASRPWQRGAKPEHNARHNRGVACALCPPWGSVDPAAPSLPPFSTPCELGKSVKEQLRLNYVWKDQALAMWRISTCGLD